MNDTGAQQNKKNGASRYLLIGLFCLFGAAVLDALTHREEKILLATEQMQDDTFKETVIAVGGNWLTGWSGVILNKPLNDTEKKELPAVIRSLNREVGFGGPVGFPDTYYLLDRHEDKVTGKVSFWLQEWEAALRDRPELPDLIRNDTAPYHYRIFAGFSGWAPIQLENEFKMTNGWDGMAMDPDIIWNPAIKAGWDALHRKKREKLMKRPRQAL